MQTFLSWLSSEPIMQQVLSDESKQKVCIITDINKMMKAMTGDNITANEFDYMYDMTLDQLQTLETQSALNVEAEMRWRQYQQALREGLNGDGDAD